MNYSGSSSKAEIRSAFYHDKCDKYDYLISVGCGAVVGLVDIFFVGDPTNSELKPWSDVQVDNAVMSFARLCGWNPREGKENNVASAIGKLEQTFRVNYDQQHSGKVGNLFKMSTKNHHMKSLGHSPDPLGLFFSIINQFTSTSTFLSDGQLITVQTETFELKGKTFISKLYCGMVNWLGHIMSDIAGSSSAVGRGSGITIPFYELFQLCDFGSFEVDNNRNTLAKLATKVFEQGYDARFGLTMAIPVILCDLLIKLVWSIKHYFYHKRPLTECIPNKQHDDLRVMLIFGNGTLCLMDGADAALRSGGSWVNFFLRINLIAWFRLAYLVLRELCIRSNLSYSLQKQLDAYIRINEALTVYITQLQKIDFERFRRETALYRQMLKCLENVNNEKDLKVLLKIEYKAMGIALPYQGNFDEFMNDKNSILEFR